MENGDAESAGEPASRAPRSWWAWPVIVVATVALVTSARLVPDAGQPEAQPDADAPDRMGLAILEFQAKNIIGVSSLSGSDEMGEVIGQLKSSLAGGNPAVIGSIAALEVFASLDGDARNNALDFIDADLAERDSPPELLEAIRLAIAEPEALGDGEWQRLRNELGWFGDLLAATEGGPDESRADRIRDDAARVAKIFLIGLLALVGAGVIGAVLLFLALYRASHDRLHTALERPPPRLAVILLEAFAIYLGVMACGDFVALTMMAKASASSGIVAVAEWISIGTLPLSLVAALVWMGHRWRACRAGVRETADSDGNGEAAVGLRRSMGLHAGRGFFAEVGCGIVGYMAMLPVIALGLVGTAILAVLTGLFAGDEEAAGAAPMAHPIVEWMAAGDLRVMLLALFLAAVVAPLFEETMFRGAFHGALRGRSGFWLAAFVNALVFAAVHPQGLLAIPALGAMGFGFSMIREWRGSLIAPMAAHSLHNGMLVAAMWLVFG